MIPDRFPPAKMALKVSGGLRSARGGDSNLQSRGLPRNRAAPEISRISENLSWLLEHRNSSTDLIVDTR